MRILQKKNVNFEVYKSEVEKLCLQNTNPLADRQTDRCAPKHLMQEYKSACVIFTELELLLYFPLYIN